MVTRGFDQFVAKEEASRERRDNPFADMRLGNGWAKSRAIVMQRLRELKNEGKLRLTDILRQPEPLSILALECLTHVWKGTPAQGETPFADMRFRFRCKAADTRKYKIGVRIVETVDVGGGISVPGEVSEYQLLEPQYVAIPGGTEVELGIMQAIRLLQMYGEDLSRSRKQAAGRPWVELESTPEEPTGFDAIGKTTKSARAA